MSLPFTTATSGYLSYDPADFTTSSLGYVDPTTGVITLSGTPSSSLSTGSILTYSTPSIYSTPSTLTPSYLTYTTMEPYAGMTEVDHETGIIRVFDGVEWQEIKVQDPNRIETEEEIVAKEFDVLLNDIKQEIYG